MEKNMDNDYKPKPVRNDHYWRYKKKTPPKEEYPGMNGEAIVVKPKA